MYFEVLVVRASREFAAWTSARAVGVPTSVGTLWASVAAMACKDFVAGATSTTGERSSAGIWQQAVLPLDLGNSIIPHAVVSWLARTAWGMMLFPKSRD